jgi:hypothetical protein
MKIAEATTAPAIINSILVLFVLVMKYFDLGVQRIHLVFYSMGFDESIHEIFRLLR